MQAVVILYDNLGMWMGYCKHNRGSNKNAPFLGLLLTLRTPPFMALFKHTVLCDIFLFNTAMLHQHTVHLSYGILTRLKFLI